MVNPKVEPGMIAGRTRGGNHLRYNIISVAAYPRDRYDAALGV